jgi:hemolysin D
MTAASPPAATRATTGATTGTPLHPGLLARYTRVLRLSWRDRAAMAPPGRTPLERQFLPAALEIVETPAPVLAHALLWTVVAALLVALAWAHFGKVDVVAVAQGQVIAAGRAKLIQPAETAVVKRIHVTDGQAVKAGEVLVELEAAGTATQAEVERLREAWTAARLEAARESALARAVQGGMGAVPVLKLETPANDPTNPTPDTAVPAARLATEAQVLAAEFADHRSRLAAVEADIARRSAERDSARELAAKLGRTAPIAQRRAEDYRALVEKQFISEHGWLEREQARLEQEGDLAFQQARVRELEAAVEEGRRRRASLVAEAGQWALRRALDAGQRATQLAQELAKAASRHRQQVLVAPVEGTVQQLAIHTEGGVVQEAQPLMVIAPSDYQAEVEAVLENRDVGFVKVGQRAQVKVETFPFTRYGTIPGVVSFVSPDAVNDAKRGMVFQVRVKLDRGTLKVDEREVQLSPGMAVSVEAMTGKRSVLQYVLEPVRRTVGEGFRER